MDVYKSSTTLAILLDGSDEPEVINLAKHFRADNLKPVPIPDEDCEAARQPGQPLRI